MSKERATDEDYKYFVNSLYRQNLTAEEIEQKIKEWCKKHRY